MDYIASQPYIKIERVVTSTEQIDTEHARTLYLYSDRIVTKHREFPIEEVINVSYRKNNQENGLLYIHTSSGLFSYTIKSTPEHFLKTYEDHFKQ